MSDFNSGHDLDKLDLIMAAIAALVLLALAVWGLMGVLS